MTETTSSLDSIRSAPWFSCAAAFASATLLVESSPAAIPVLFGSPFVSAGLAVPATLNLFDKKRSGLSKIFSGAAAAVGVAGPLMLLSMSGPDVLGAFFFTTLSMAGAGTLNVISHFTRNVGRDVSIKIPLGKKDDNAPKGP